MSEFKEAELGMRILPGVDLTLWLRIAVLVLMTAMAAGIFVAI